MKEISAPTQLNTQFRITATRDATHRDNTQTPDKGMVHTCAYKYLHKSNKDDILLVMYNFEFLLQHNFIAGTLFIT